MMPYDWDELEEDRDATEWGRQKFSSSPLDYNGADMMIVLYEYGGDFESFTEFMGCTWSYLRGELAKSNVYQTCNIYLWGKLARYILHKRGNDKPKSEEVRRLESQMHEFLRNGKKEEMDD